MFRVFVLNKYYGEIKVSLNMEHVPDSYVYSTITNSWGKSNGVVYTCINTDEVPEHYLLLNQLLD